MIHLLSNMSLMLSVLCMVTLIGLGFARLCGLHNFRQRVLLAPTLALAISGILVAVVVLIGIPVGKASPVIWSLWILLAALGVSCVRSACSDLDHRYVVLASVLATLVVTGGFLRYGLLDYLGSPALDGWAYAGFGEYLRLHPKGAEGGLAPLYQYASHLSATRYVASAMLALLIPPWMDGVDTQMMVGPLLIWSVFSFSLSVAYAARTANQRGLNAPAWLTVFIGVVGGWVPFALNANNYDNLLALPFAPALFALASDRSLNRIEQILLPAILIAASIYIYPELSPLIVAAYSVVVIEDLFSIQREHMGWMNVRIQLVKCMVIVMAALVIVSPYLHDAIRFFSSQLSAASQMTGRPGEGMVPGLLNNLRVWGAMWGLGSSSGGIVVGVLLAQVALFGIAVAFQKRYFSLILLLGMTGVLFVVMIALKKYDYGAYKILLMGWWAVAIVLAVGAKGIWNIVSVKNLTLRIYMHVAILSVLFVANAVWLYQPYQWVRQYTYKTATATREAKDGVLKSGGAVQVSVNDTTLNAWLVYQLRDAKAIFTNFDGYMGVAHVRPLMNRSIVFDQDEIKYILTDLHSFAAGELVWKNDLFKLVKGTLDQQPPLLEINAPNGREVLQSMQFFWIGRQPVSINLLNKKSRLVQIDFEAFVGPSVGDSARDLPQVVVETEGKQLLKIDAGVPKMHTVQIMLSPGRNALVFSSDYAGSIFPNSNGDPRTLIAGIKLVQLTVIE